MTTEEERVLSTHQKLKAVCELIGYKIKDEHCWYNGKTFERTYGDATCDEREIIFTQEFMDKFIGYIDKDLTLNKNLSYNSHIGTLDTIKGRILKNLDNPTDYLYSLIF